jgi:CBS domain-containing protein
MTPAPVTMTSDKSVIEALRLMWDCGIRHVPVMDGDKVVGVVSRADFKGLEQSRLEDERELWERL